MAPPSKALKSSITNKIYNKTLDIRRLLDSYDRNGHTAFMLSEALAESRKLIKMIEKEIETAGSIEGVIMYLHNPDEVTV